MFHIKILQVLTEMQLFCQAGTVVPMVESHTNSGQLYRKWTAVPRVDSHADKWTFVLTVDQTVAPAVNSKLYRVINCTNSGHLY